MFHFTTYLHSLTTTNLLAKSNKFFPCTCTGLGGIEGVLYNFKKQANFICASDTCEGRTVQIGGSWQQRRVYTAFIVARYKDGDEKDRDSKMNLCRELFTQFKSKMIHDSEEDESMVSLNTEDIKYQEMGHFLPGCTGLYFIISEDLPENLCYKPEQWESKKP